MEPKRRPQGKTDALPERDKLDRRYGEIGISAVKAAVQPQGNSISSSRVLVQE